MFLLVFANLAYADYSNWTNNGGDRLWTNHLNWSLNAVPTQWTAVTIDKPGAQGPIVSTNVIVYGIDGPGKSLAGQTNMDITGGTFKVTSTNWTIGINSGSIGVLNLSNASVQVDCGLNVGQNGSGTINMSSGSINVNGNIWIPSGSGGTGRINLYGGTITANNLYLYSGGTPRIDITSGKIVIAGDQTTNINSYIANGWITAYGGAGTVSVVYDSSTYKTTISATGPITNAADPVPASDTNVAPSITKLSWTMPQPLKADSQVTCDVYLGTDPNLSGAEKIVNGQSVSNVSIQGLVTAGQAYYWRVDCYDTSDSGIVKTIGTVWKFTVSSTSVQYTELASPNGSLLARIFVNSSGHLAYNLTRSSTTIINDSKMGIIINNTDLGNGVVFAGEGIRNEVNQTYAWRGRKSLATDHYKSSILNVMHNQTGTSWTLEARAYNDGLAFRYIVPGSGTRTINGESTEWVLPSGSSIWYETNTLHAEAYYSKKTPTAIAANTHIGLPVTVELSSNNYAAITEGALQNYSGLSLMATGTTRLVSNFENFPLFSDPSDNVPGPANWQQSGTITTPWRIIMTGPSLNELVNCDIVNNVCPAPDTNLYPQGIMTDWIREGRATWNYIIDVTSDFNTLKGLVDEASELGFEYTVLDAGWWNMSNGGKDAYSSLADICNYAKTKNIKVMVWAALVDYKDYSTRQWFFNALKQAGCSGVKFDFIWGEDLATVQLLSTVLQEAVNYKLLINWHGNAKPTGNARTWPNQITCKAVKGLEYFMWETPPLSHYATIPFTRLLAGPADTTPCTFTTDLLRGTTFSFQLATAIVHDSPLMHWGDWPDLYLVSPAVDMIRSIPSTWDETRVLSGSQIGTIAALAKRKGNDWFVGILNGTNSRRTYSLNLSFLGSGNYYALTVKDKLGYPSSMTVGNSIVNNSQIISVTLEAGGGYSARFTKINLSPENSWSVSSQLVTIQNYFNGTDLRYTLDGSEPNINSPAYIGPINIINSCLLRAKVISGDGNGAQACGYYKIVPAVPPLPDVYHSDLSWDSQSVGWGTTAQINRSIQGNSLVVAGTTYQKGIGAHSHSEIVYTLNSSYKYFVAVAGIDDEVTSDRPSVVFKIYVDGVLLAQSPVVRRHQFWNFNIRLPQNGSQLKLVATTGDDTNHSDHADWVNAGFKTHSDFSYLSTLLNNWLRTDCSESGSCDGMDFNSDGSVNFEDFALIAQDWL